PVRTDGDTANLPDRGWDWALETAIIGNEAGITPNILCGLSITVLPEFQRRGVGTTMIKHVVSLAAKHGFHKVIMPVRPISKHKWPFLTMQEFLTWRGRDSFHDDPWFRDYEQTGGVVASMCNRSLTIVT